MEVSRRQFLQLLGAVVVSAATPELLRWDGVATADWPGYKGPWLDLDCSALAPGTYTFSAFAKGIGGEWKRLAVHGLTAKGGETTLRVPLDLERPMLSNIGIQLERTAASPAHYIDADGLTRESTRTNFALRTYGPRPRRKWAR